jgi:multiple sugar transport system permease protein
MTSISDATTMVSLSKAHAPRGKQRPWFRPVYFFIVIWLIGVLGPYAWMFITSITPQAELVHSAERIWPENPNLAAYRYLFSNPRFIAYAFNSAVVAIGTVIVTTTLALLAGTALSRYRFRGRTFVLLGTLLLQLFPTILLITPLYIEMKTFGLLDTKHGLMLVYAAFSLPFSTWLMKGYVDQIPVEIEEAALIDGCSRFQTFIYVIVPLTKPGTAAVATFAFIYAWNEFIYALTFTQTLSARTLPVGLRLFIGESSINWQYITAAGVLAAIPVLVGFMIAQRSLISGLTSGAVKG